MKRIYYEELELINVGKRGRSYKYPPYLFAPVLIIKLMIFRDYREVATELDGIFRKDLHLNINFRTPRRRISMIDIRDYLDRYIEMLEEEEVEVAMDSSSLMLNNWG